MFAVRTIQTKNSARAMNPWLYMIHQTSPWVPTGGVFSRGVGAPHPVRGDSRAPPQASSYRAPRDSLLAVAVSILVSAKAPSGVTTSVTAATTVTVAATFRPVQSPLTARRTAQ